MRQWLARVLFPAKGLCAVLMATLGLSAVGGGVTCAQQVSRERSGGVLVASAKVAEDPHEAGLRGEGSGSLSGAVVDADGAAVPDAEISVVETGSATVLSARSGADGTFLLPHAPPTKYQVTVTRAGFGSWKGSVTLSATQPSSLGEICLPAAVEESVEVRASSHDVAEAQVTLEEQQRVLGVFPNFYASYAPDAEPLSVGQKLRLAVRFSVDPVSFLMAGVVARSEQRVNAFPGYGRGSAGYARRFGAAYGDGLSSTLFGQALLPAVFHQDPRYFVKGTGSVPSRVLYAMASAVVCKGDNRRWQMNYSNVAGNFLSAGLSNAYYPAAQRGMGLVASNALMATGLGAVGGLFQEFLLRRMTPRVPEYAAVR